MQAHAPAWNKVDVIHHVAETRGHRTYLEISTPTTGGFFGLVDRSRFDRCLRLMYRCPDDFADGLRIDFRTPGLDITPCLAELRRQHVGIDLVFVDAWHEYETAARDLREGFALLSDGGTLVVHDCLPESADRATETVTADCWWGVSYRAYIDFVTARTGLDYCTVD